MKDFSSKWRGVHPEGVLKKCFWECESLLSRLFEIQIFLYLNYLNFEENRTSKLVYSYLGVSTVPEGFTLKGTKGRGRKGKEANSGFSIEQQRHRQI